MSAIIKLFLITLIAFVSSGMSNFAGFGTGTISMPLLLQLLPFDQTLLLAGILQWVSGLCKMLGFFRYVKWKIVIIFGIPALIASVIGSYLIFVVPHDILYRLLGVFFIFYSQILIFNPEFQVKRTWYNTFSGGIIYGLSAGIFGSRGPVRTIFLTAYDLPKKEYIATSGAISLFADISRLFVYIFGGVALEPFVLKGLIIIIPITIAGAFIAQILVKKLPQRKFEIIIAIFLALVGLQLIIFGKSH